MKRLLIIIAFAAATLLAVSCGRGNRSHANEDESAVDTTSYSFENLPDEPIFDIITSMGTIRVKLYSKTPKHRENFINLVKEHYYDGVLFHRVINHFMIQAGDPLTKDQTKMDQWGTGGPGYTIPAEFIGEYYHKKGALAAARKGDAANPKKASHGSQFYLVQDEDNCLWLDGEYTVFGETVQGFEVIDRIAAVKTDEADRPLRPVKILSITLSSDQNITPDSPNAFDSDWVDNYEDDYDDGMTEAEAAEMENAEELDKAAAEGTPASGEGIEAADSLNAATGMTEAAGATDGTQPGEEGTQDEAAPAEQTGTGDQATPVEQQDGSGNDKVVPVEQQDGSGNDKVVPVEQQDGDKILPVE